MARFAGVSGGSRQFPIGPGNAPVVCQGPTRLRRGARFPVRVGNGRARSVASQHVPGRGDDGRAGAAVATGSASVVFPPSAFRAAAAEAWPCRPWRWGAYR